MRRGNRSKRPAGAHAAIKKRAIQNGAVQSGTIERVHERQARAMPAVRHQAFAEFDSVTGAIAKLAAIGLALRPTASISVARSPVRWLVVEPLIVVETRLMTEARATRSTRSAQCSIGGVAQGELLARAFQSLAQRLFAEQMLDGLRAGIAAVQGARRAAKTFARRNVPLINADAANQNAARSDVES